MAVSFFITLLRESSLGEGSHRAQRIERKWIALKNIISDTAGHFMFLTNVNYQHSNTLYDLSQEFPVFTFLPVVIPVNFCAGN